MSIRISSKTDATATLKLYNQLVSYMFEQEFGELRRYATSEDMEALNKAKKALGNIVAKGK